MNPSRLRGLLRDPAVVVTLLAATTVLVAILEDRVGIADAATTYLLAVVAAAALLGVTAAIATAVGAFLLYDLLFVTPTGALSVADSQEWLALLLFLVIGVVVAWLAGQSRRGARDASAREAEANALYQVTRVLATRADVVSVLPQVETSLMRATGSERAAIVLGSASAARLAAEIPSPAWVARDRGVLRRRAGVAEATWVRLHGSALTHRGNGDAIAWKVPIEAAGRTLGALWLLRGRAIGPPDAAATRMLGLAVDQVGQAVEQERLGSEARDLAIARESEALKSALLDSVSHDLRTPLASIRAAAGTLLDPDIDLDPAERRASAEAIDHEADHLARLVSDLLDMSRIEGRALVPDLDVYDVGDLVDRTLERLVPRLGGRTVSRFDDTGLPPVRVDAVLFDQVLANLVENATKYAPIEAPLRVAIARRDDIIRVTVEDGGPGVPRSALPHVFDKFYRVPRTGEGSRPGSGIGLAVVRGFVLAMGGQVQARRSELGGLAIDVLLPGAPAIPEEGGAGPAAQGQVAEDAT